MKAYPDEGKLKRMVRIVFGKALQAVAEGSDHTERVDKLIEWAEAEGKVVDLVRGAHRHNHLNEQLRNFCSTYSQELLKESCADMPNVLQQDTVFAFVGLPLTAAIPIAQVVSTGLAVLPSGASDNPDDIDFKDFSNDELLPVMRLYGFLRLALAKFPQPKDQPPTLLLFARELHQAVEEPAKTPLVEWIRRVEAEYKISAEPASSQPGASTKQGMLEVSLMVTVRRYSKQLPNQPLQYQVDGCLYFDQVVGRPSLGEPPKPPVALSLPEAPDELGVVCPWEQVAERTDQFLSAAIRQLNHPVKQELGYKYYRLSIELFLPLDYMGAEVDRWPRVSRQEPLGKAYGVIVRFCDRINDDERLNELFLVWDKLQSLLKSPNGNIDLHRQFESPTNLGEYASWQNLEANLKQKIGIKLCCGLPESSPDQKGLFEAILYSDVPIAVWTRSTDLVEPDPESGELRAVEISKALDSFLTVERFRQPVTLSDELKRVRQAALSVSAEGIKGRCLGDHISLLLDNPDRLPLFPQLGS
ncbi:effector-associated domain EAD1-containing protein [Leptolyngbya sp. SLC-A1]|nr:hypothetical protein [Phormidium sp. FACHB-77]MBD2054310.1 hypothetical protein [Leptolyngbya sp. FACHB-60]